MYSCPECGKNDVGGLAICACGADLTLLRHLDAVADAWFNRGLAAAADGRTGEALEWLSACCIARPTDAEARRTQAKAWAQLGHWPQARKALEQAEAIDPECPELKAIREAVSAAEKRSTTRKRASARKRAKRRKAVTKTKRPQADGNAPSETERIKGPGNQLACGDDRDRHEKES